MDKQEGALRSFGKQLSQLRGQQGLTVAELASRSGLDASEISAIEAGRKDIHITAVFRLAAGLGVAPAELLRSL